ncbi:MAG: hypothetical protein NUW01_06780 [Gemmatimonadaceae bacterium]|nr:hypothetical protein [Gemmatimonadaceae bacterium]
MSIELESPRSGRTPPAGDSLIVVKFGGAALATLSRVRAAAARVRSLRDAGHTLVAEGPYGCASLRELRPGRVEQLLARGVVPVVPGFQGIRADGELVTLGRGGSDVTAVFLASELNARECHLVKDVDGIYDRDPAVVAEASRFDYLSFDGLVKLTAGGARVVHSDAALRAKQDTVLLRVYRYDAAFAGPRGTRVGAEVVS